MKNVVKLLVVLGLVATGTAAMADWGAPLKWNQFDNTDPHGRTIQTWFSSNPSQGQLVADDFLCTQTGWINELRVRGHDDDYNFGVKVYIWADVPTTSNDESHPGTLLKSWNLGKADAGDPHKIGWSDAGNGEYRINLPENDWFMQEGTSANPIIYWVGVQAHHDILGIEQFHWNYRDNLQNDNPNPTDIHNLDDAVVWDAALGSWKHLGAWYNEDWFNGNHWEFTSYTGTLPAGYRSVDMEFQVYGTPEPASLVLLAAASFVLRRRR